MRKKKRETWKIATAGFAVGLGLTAVATAILFQLPVGQDLIRTIRFGPDYTVAARQSAPTRHRQAPTPAPPPAARASPVLLNGRPLPSSVTLIENVSGLIGRTRIPLSAGEHLKVSAFRDTFFVCDYHGDTVFVPIVSTDWTASAP